MTENTMDPQSEAPKSGQSTPEATPTALGSPDAAGKPDATGKTVGLSQRQTERPETESATANDDAVTKAKKEAMDSVPDELKGDLPPEMEKHMDIIQDTSKSASELASAVQSFGDMSQDDARTLLMNAGHKKEKVDEAVAQLPEGRSSLRERIDQDGTTPAPLADELKADLKSEIPTLDEVTKGVKAVAEGTGPLSEDEMAILDKAEKASSSWRERLQKSGRMFGKGLITILLTSVISYIFLLKLYAGAAAKRGR